MIVQDSTTGAMSIVEGDEKHLVSAGVYAALDQPFVFSIPDAEYTAIPTGLPYFPDGIIVQDSNTGAMSIVEGGEKLLVSTAVYQYLGDPPTTSVTDAQYTAIPTGIQYFPDGMMVRDQATGAIDIILAGEKHAVSSEVYSYLDDPTPDTIPDAQFNAIPTGLAYFADGMFVSDDQTGSKAIILAGQKHSISLEVYDYLGSPQLTIVPDAEYRRFPRGCRISRTG